MVRHGKVSFGKAGLVWQVWVSNVPVRQVRRGVAR